MSTTSSTISLITNAPDIASFNRGPLLTTFIAPDSCLSTLTFGSVMYFGHRLNGYVDAACYPGSTTEAGAGTAAWNVYYYSPGVCPQGWSHAQTITSSFGRLATQVEIGTGTTVVVCCPSGYVAAADDHQCTSTFSSEVLPYIHPTLNALNQWAGTNASAPSTTTAYGTPYHIYGDGIPIWWQSSDIKSFADAATMTSTPPIPDTTPKGSETSPQILAGASPTNASSISHFSSAGISSGAKIAIAVVIPILVATFALAAAVYFMCKRRKALREFRIGSTHPTIGEMICFPQAKRELGTEGRVSELYSDNPKTPVRVSELPGAANINVSTTTPSELAG